MSAFDNTFSSVYGLIDYSDFKSIYTDLEKTKSERLKIDLIASRIFLVSSLLRTSESIGALVIYLLLTCFDILGQNKEWVSFENWLHSRKKDTERNDIICKIDDNKELLQKVKDIHLEYNKIYGARNSFNNFIDNILPNEPRLRLLDSIKKYPDGVINRTENKKLLYEIRNNYTHQGSGIPIGVVFNNRTFPPFWTYYVGDYKD